MNKRDQDTVRNVALVTFAAVVVSKVLDGVDSFFGGDDPDPLLPPGMYPPDITEPPTLSAQQVAWIAQGIYAAVYGDGSFWNGSGTENEDVVVELLQLAMNDADVLAISDAYGSRSGWFSLSGSLTLFGVVAEYLSPGDIEAINNNYASKGIAISFAA
jgi:hypothetical protein